MHRFLTEYALLIYFVEIYLQASGVVRVPHMFWIHACHVFSLCICVENMCTPIMSIREATYLSPDVGKRYFPVPMDMPVTMIMKTVFCLVSVWTHLPTALKFQLDSSRPILEYLPAVQPSVLLSARVEPKFLKRKSLWQLTFFFSSS